MPSKYDPLRRFLEAQPADEPVSLTLDEITALVGALPPSSATSMWWSNTVGHSQALAWLQAGRRAIELRLGDAVVFSPVSVQITTPSFRGRPRDNTGRGLHPVMDGVGVLDKVLRAAGYPTIVSAVAAHTLFLHPDTVAQTHGQPLFPVIRDPTRRGIIEAQPDGARVMYDDNTTPTLCFLWASRRARGADVQYNHIWGDPRNPATYTALWNLCVTPAFLAKTTDGSNHPDVIAALRYRAVDLFDTWPSGEERPAKPDGYDALTWLAPPEPLADLAAELRARLLRAQASPPSRAARDIGWLFSDWQPAL
jgi:hypothetical protein